MLHERRAGRIRSGFAFTVRERFRYRERRRQRSLSAFGRAAPLQAWRRCPSGSRTTTGPLAHDAAVRAPRGRSVDDRCLHGGRKWGRNPALKGGHLRRRISKASRGVPHNVGTVGTDAARKALGGSSDAAAYEQRCKDAFHDAPRSAQPSLPSFHLIIRPARDSPLIFARRDVGRSQSRGRRGSSVRTGNDIPPGTRCRSGC